MENELRANELEKLEKCKRQKDALESIVEYLKETDPSCICLKAEGVIPVNYVWISALNLNLIEVKELVDKAKKITLEHLEKELEQITKTHNTLFSRLAFFTLSN